MKRKPSIDISQPVEFEITTPELPSFIITGTYVDVAPIYDEFSRQSAKGPCTRQPSTVSTLAEQIRTRTIRRWKEDVRAGLYDYQHGTRFLKTLREKRQIERDMHMAQSLGLLDAVVCAKHRKALTDAKALR